MGKDWAKGLTAATDARVARNAAAHRGIAYLRHLPPGQDRRMLHRRTAPLEWGARLAYVVGLIATDGCLVNTGRHVSFTTSDRQLMETFLSCLGRDARYRTTKTRLGSDLYRIQMGDVALYRWLTSIGLTQRKSLTLGSIEVPDALLFDLVRGLLDGDGTISNFVHHPTVKTYPGYEYERLLVKFCSASRAHLEWLRSRLEGAIGIHASIRRARPRPGRHDHFDLVYGKRASVALLRKLYADPAMPCLLRKRAIWESDRRRNCAEGGT